MRIEIIEHCFGSDVRIDGESIHQHEHDKRSDDDVIKLQDFLISELSTIKDQLDMSDWKNIAEIVVRRGRYSFDETSSSQDDCDQCGNYNTTETYDKNND